MPYPLFGTVLHLDDTQKAQTYVGYVLVQIYRDRVAVGPVAHPTARHGIRQADTVHWFIIACSELFPTEVAHPAHILLHYVVPIGQFAGMMRYLLSPAGRGGAAPKLVARPIHLDW